MYRLATSLPVEGEPSLVPEIAFDPRGQLFAVTLLQADEVRLYRASDRALLRTFANPASELDKPHAVLLTDRHLIVACRHLTERPATLSVFALDSASQAPLFTLETPVTHLREGHSMALLGDILVITHCHNAGSAGALLSYRFNGNTGEISGPIDHREACFEKLGLAKGVAFSPAGDQVLVSFNSDKSTNVLQKLGFKLFKARNVMQSDGLRGLIRHRLAGKNPMDQPKVFLGNGIAVFDIDSEGYFSSQPSRVIARREFCRLENIAVSGNLVALADTINNRVHIFDYANDPELENPVQTISENMSLPHGVKFSPDNRLLVVSNYGLRSRKQLIHWGHATSPRSDNVQVFEIAPDSAQLAP